MSVDLTPNEVIASRSADSCSNISVHEAFLLSRVKDHTPIGPLKALYRDLFDFDNTLDGLVQKGCVDLSRREPSEVLYTIPLRGAQATLIDSDFRAKRAWVEIQTGEPLRKALYRLNWVSGEVERIVGASKPSLMSAIRFVIPPSPISREQVTPDYRLGPAPIATSKSGIHRVYDRNPDILETGMFYVSEDSGIGPIKLESEGATGTQPIFNPDDSGCVVWLQTSPSPAIMVSEPFQALRKVLDVMGAASICWQDANTLLVLCHSSGDLISVGRRGKAVKHLTRCNGPQRGLWIDPIQRTVTTLGEDLMFRWISVKSGNILEQMQLLERPDAAILREDGVLVTLHKESVSIVRFKDQSVSHLRERVHPSSFTAHMNWRSDQPLVLLKVDRLNAELIQVSI